MYQFLVSHKRGNYKYLRGFKLKFDCGEFNMVLLDPDKFVCAEHNYGKILSCDMSSCNVGEHLFEYRGGIDTSACRDGTVSKGFAG